MGMSKNKTIITVAVIILVVFAIMISCNKSSEYMRSGGGSGRGSGGRMSSGRGSGGGISSGRMSSGRMSGSRLASRGSSRSSGRGSSRTGRYGDSGRWNNWGRHGRWGNWNNGYWGNWNGWGGWSGRLGWGWDWPYYTRWAPSGLYNDADDIWGLYGDRWGYYNPNPVTDDYTVYTIIYQDDDIYNIVDEDLNLIKKIKGHTDLKKYLNENKNNILFVIKQ
jgi:hypothetical protein